MRIFCFFCFKMDLTSNYQLGSYVEWSYVFIVSWWINKDTIEYYSIIKQLVALDRNIRFQLPVGIDFSAKVCVCVCTHVLKDHFL